ncbi:hypothetical protein IWQ47_001620 [Aquimarina sp. EL_43]|uniref:hypothetical protein n=1 Tax=unclassified Aquimarina TaxID=2627091 RepID=UPI0018C91F8E|nr:MULTISPECIES: hypothetical protein [unclassified Aquimarina]MBG6130297.1 hypothetical protein [Aquimarina sp. EL_35]MBG6149077.1 hypothetical protein [Aquimarina sp. EL_32]MBG6168549.1 hypothetical protein [Aquimarina sp. EL_43]
MKTLKYILIAILLGVNFASCTPDDSVKENETLKTEVLSTDGDDEGIEDDEI